MLFHFVNAAMLALLGQRLAQGVNAGASSAYMPACIIVAQLVMIPFSCLTGKIAPQGRRRLSLIGFEALPIRGLLYTLTSDPVLLVAIQILDGISEGGLGVLASRQHPDGSG